MKINFFYKCKLIKVIDGDTIDALIELGFDTYVLRRIRFYGIDAWETRTKDKEEKKKGLAAKRFVEDIFKKHNGIFFMKTYKKGKYRRYLGEIFFEDEDKSLNDILLESGHAKAYMTKK